MVSASPATPEVTPEPHSGEEMKGPGGNPPGPFIHPIDGCHKGRARYGTARLRNPLGIPPASAG